MIHNIKSFLPSCFLIIALTTIDTLEMPAPALNEVLHILCLAWIMSINPKNQSNGIKPSLTKMQEILYSQIGFQKLHIKRPMHLQACVSFAVVAGVFTLRWFSFPLRTCLNLISSHLWLYNHYGFSLPYFIQRYFS